MVDKEQGWVTLASLSLLSFLNNLPSLAATMGKRKRSRKDGDSDDSDGEIQFERVGGDSDDGGDFDGGDGDDDRRSVCATIHHVLYQLLCSSSSGSLPLPWP
jgi:hypothetical protein